MDLIKPHKLGRKLRLKKTDPAETFGLPGKEEIEKLTEKRAQEIGELQDLLYADSTQGLLVVLEGMDTAGKDGTIRKVFDNVNPSGVLVKSFKIPTPLERAHDFLWRVHAAAPPLGSIGIFNRSHYEDVLAVRVHAEQFLPAHLLDDPDIWKKRHAMINDFESTLVQNGTRIVKFFLHISKNEQRDRMRQRQKDPAKHWKLSEDDIKERAFWSRYQAVYEEVIPCTSTVYAPWYIIPADHKWVCHYLVATIVRKILKEMKPHPRQVVNKRLLKMKIV
jgi:PPK2 family polyphosphate:nucleotide phosphotransferase